MSKFVILDRDGVINEDSDAYIKSPDEWLPIPGSLEAIALLTQQGYRTVVLTNQSGIARGLFDLSTLDRIHDKMRAAVEATGGRIDDVFVCPHGPEDGCACRKPKPGLFHAFAEKYKVDLKTVPAIGDSFRDIQAAQAAGAQPILVETGKGARTLARYPNLDIPIFPTLYAAVQYILFEAR
ncbi:D-glycero-beta-D-manno-heptose 1,7-bisphosphate 7-phosphatase [Methylocaldum szegediense]|uniref:D,D-heptose 1,7-bisphosphate phosphatase n=1 Tax=Methylocaldum szegediense TaxID=73780 RepID=A0ABM9I0S3_9GAMM|nr:D-glycero-beta-D-manno-heptose 1,7-bisphosphate 7-phosphatase [Methylocaldum szegediense]CAI8814902.1 D-glycero-beta-D-manno-heptose-1,7-bisphosphate 7-phosphatase [Methylocaldum szegediense]